MTEEWVSRMFTIQKVGQEIEEKPSNFDSLGYGHTTPTWLGGRRRKIHFVPFTFASFVHVAYV